MNTTTSAYHQQFSAKHAVLPVIHVESVEQALRNTDIAVRVGADGVFLINHSDSYRHLLNVHREVRKRFPGLWIGLNCLDLSPLQVFGQVDETVSGIWSDNAGIDESRSTQAEADKIREARLASGWQGLWFGGVAFKYQRQVEDLAHAAVLARDYMDVVTTSGAGTGLAAHVAKIVTMKQAIGTFPLAIASGITPENIGAYLGHADCFLVATGIGLSFTEIDPERAHALIAAVRQYDNSGEGAGDPGGATSCRSVCFVCEWNEGRSVHLELSVRAKLQGSPVRVTSAGLRPGGGINALRRDHLLRQGVPAGEIDAHRSHLFSNESAGVDLVLVAEPWMQADILGRFPGLKGRIMTARGFAQGRSPETDLDEAAAVIEDAVGKSPARKLELYAELEEIACGTALRLTRG